MRISRLFVIKIILLGETVRRKILFVTTRLFWPTDSGRKLSLYYYCKGLYEKYDCDIYLYSFLEAEKSKEDIVNKPDFIKEVRLASSISIFEKVKNLIINTILKCSWPIQCSLFYSKKNKNQIESYCNEIDPDFIFTDMIRTAMYIESFNESNAVTILDMDDLLSKRYNRQLQSNIKSNITGQYTGKLPVFLNKLITNSFIKKSILKIEYYLTKKAEIYYSEQYDKVIFVSQVETDYLNKKITHKAITIPVGINAINEDVISIYNYEENVLTFVGNLKVAANIDSLAWIVNDIIPNIKHDVKLMVIGACPEDIKQKYSENSKVIFTGRVDNLALYVRKGQIFLSPLLYGTGIKTKILEAMSMGVPVVTNDVGVEGIDVQNGRDIWIENDSLAIANRVDILLDNYHIALESAQYAKQIVEEKYEWNKIWEKFSEIFSIKHKR